MRAGIVVTGTEVLSELVRDENGPWLSGALRERGVELAHVMVVGDRADDLTAALRFLA
ncbi:MAG TPA: molybdopterin-binding protein, partial [Solirubrobacteraceae bacterium]|nr:molybdopterin-binding protein [Solirubrobacteraceae bacterium]